MRRGRQQEQVRGRFGEQPPESVARDLLPVAGDSMRLIDDHDIPAGGRQVRGPRDVVALDPLGIPALAPVEWLDRVERDDEAVVGQPEVVLTPASESADLGGRQCHELLIEASRELPLPLGNETLRRNDRAPGELVRGPAAP